MTTQEGVTYLDSWKHATDPSDPKIRTCHEDGTHHWSDLKHLARSGLHYIYAVNHPVVANRIMRVGTVVHLHVLGKRPGAKPLVKWTGKVRRGKEWDAFRERHADAEIIAESEWSAAEEIAEAVLAHPVARARLVGAKREVALEWEEDGMKFSTSGIDIVRQELEWIGDLKTCAPTLLQPEALSRHALKMNYHCQVAFYARGARANGIKVRESSLLCVETAAPYDVVELALTPGVLDLAERTLSLWLERLKVFKSSSAWPGYAQSPVPWELPAWMQDAEDEDDDLEDAEEADDDADG